MHIFKPQDQHGANVRGGGFREAGDYTIGLSAAAQADLSEVIDENSEVTEEDYSIPPPGAELGPNLDSEPGNDYRRTGPGGFPANFI